ncbi:MAG: 1,2-phenylacetyl-CoA epoxidase subunit PaaC [Pseudomonadota bacterium]
MSKMQADTQITDVAEYALALGDDALVLGQRLCEWCADAPLLEEDIAIANVGLDYLGRARMLLQYAGETLGQSEDELAFLRDAPGFRNLLMVELPRGDFAFSQVRHYLLDEFESLFFAGLKQSSDPTLAGIAAKTDKEVRYHLRRSTQWMRRLAMGTQESHDRTQKALDELWGYVAEFFILTEIEERLLADNISVDRRNLEPQFKTSVGTLFDEIGLIQPSDDWKVVGGRLGQHTEHLGPMLGEMQFMQRTYPGLEW